MTDRSTQNELLPLYLAAAHAAVDFPLQTDRMAATKFDDPTVRAAHVTIYSLPFVIALRTANWSRTRRFGFLLGNWIVHFVIDSKRWYEPREGFDTRPLWFDQAWHVITLALLASLASGGDDASTI